jgi:hypothetical protein
LVTPEKPLETWGFWIGLGIGFAAGLVAFWMIVLAFDKLGL